ncbi:MAG: hypothetical protein JSV09_05850 [Thermoplasmata archaeon]|nr:MAG: hypothetical protein JSV09_05850 [Thermoplasmata archaeon]
MTEGFAFFSVLGLDLDSRVDLLFDLEVVLLLELVLLRVLVVVLLLLPLRGVDLVVELDVVREEELRDVERVELLREGEVDGVTTSALLRRVVAAEISARDGCLPKTPYRINK